jgi:hypothetical protein
VTNWLRLLGEELGLWRCCWLEDHDGEMTLRIAHKLPLGRYKAIRMSCGIGVVIRHPDGTLKGPRFVHYWHWNKELHTQNKEVIELERMIAL